jgi:hypothetical protein
MKASSPLRVVGLLVVGLAAGCGGGGSGGGGTSVDPNAPVISNARVNLSGRCTIAGVNLPGTVETTVVDYTDADGDVRGGSVEASATFAVGGTMVFTAGIPSQGVTITGTDSGTITVRACLRFGSNASASEQVKIIDASGKSSNVLTAEVANPGGLPLLAPGEDPKPRKSL